MGQEAVDALEDMANSLEKLKTLEAKMGGKIDPANKKKLEQAKAQLKSLGLGKEESEEAPKALKEPPPSAVLFIALVVFGGMIFIIVKMFLSNQKRTSKKEKKPKSNSKKTG